jgi:hypothetical protein
MKLDWFTVNHYYAGTGNIPPSFQTFDVVKREDAEALIDKLKCCGNCKHGRDADEENCQGCCEPKLEKWEMRE